MEGTAVAGELTATAAAGFARREDAARGLGRDAERIAAACHDMAVRFSRGGRLLAFGNGTPATDAQHVSVEFVHPVIVGKRALPALSLVADAPTLTGVADRAGLDEVFAHQLRVLGRGEDIALGISSDGRSANVLRGLEVAHAAGLLTVALTGGDGGPIAASAAVDHRIVVDSEDVDVVKEMHVVSYHVLWELVHVFFEQPGLLDEHGPAPAAIDPTGVEALYPFLYGGSTSLPDVTAAVARSTEQKVEEITALRAAFGREHAGGIAACAAGLARSFAAGGTLFAFGNGGSSTDAQQVAHCFLDPVGDRRPLPALCLTNDVAVMTALSNDIDFEVVFARQVRAFARAGDIVLGLSTSGNSPNVVRALAEAKAMGCVTVGLAGGDGGQMASADTIDHRFVVPSSFVPRVQEVHATAYHVLRELVAQALDPAPPVG